MITWPAVVAEETGRLVMHITHESRQTFVSSRLPHLSTSTHGFVVDPSVGGSAAAVAYGLNDNKSTADALLVPLHCRYVSHHRLGPRWKDLRYPLRPIDDGVIGVPARTGGVLKQEARKANDS